MDEEKLKKDKQFRNRNTISITLPPDVLKWLSEKVDDRTYSSRSFAIETAVRVLMKAEEKG